MTPLVFDTRPFEVLFVPPHPRAEPSQSILHYPQRAGMDLSGPRDGSSRRNGAVEEKVRVRGDSFRADDAANITRTVRFGVSEIRIFEMLEPDNSEIENAGLMEKSIAKKSKAAAQDELKELLARKQEEYKKLQAEKLKNKRQGGGKGKKGSVGGGDKGAEKGASGSSNHRGLGESPSQELLRQITASNAALGKDPFGVYMYELTTYLILISCILLFLHSYIF